MPGWHARTRELREAGKLQVVGIIEEQHPERCRLFMQWKRMEWPILVDSLDLLGVSAVPIAVLLDEHGVVRGVRPDEKDVEAFVERMFEPPADLPGPSSPPDPEALARRVNSKTAADDARAAALVEYADALFIAGADGDLSTCIEAYREAIGLGAPPEARFRLGVALRRRFESRFRERGDFQDCLDAWERALAERPNQYIWRRRIQQYGPRLIKPYSFYDWVHEARRDIAARGETPVELAVEPAGAEFAHPAKSFTTEGGAPTDPDPDGKVRRDTLGLIEIETAVAPAEIDAGSAARVHVLLRPDPRRGAAWNNEGEDLVVWIRPPEGIEVDRRLLTVSAPPAATSEETRRVELEARVPAASGGSTVSIPGYALYSVCEKATGVCRLLRQDFEVSVRVRGRARRSG